MQRILLGIKTKVYHELEKILKEKELQKSLANKIKSIEAIFPHASSRT